MQRRPSSQDISWFIDLRRNYQLDMDPPYQRRSVWNLKDQRYFLDTIFSDYPSPQIFLHKLPDPDKTIYAVVDGKQRLTTIFEFVDGNITLDPELGNDNLRGKRWDELGKAEKQKLWDYVLPVEFLVFDEDDDMAVNLAFDRLNRNMRKLEPQELRHARWDGWFIKLVESEAESDDWVKLGVVTAARTKRMKDAQFISELLLCLIEKRMHGFDQITLDGAYAKYDDVDETGANVNTDDVAEELKSVKKFFLDMQAQNSSVKKYAGTFAPFYTLWSLVVIDRSILPKPKKLAELFVKFVEKGKEILGDPALMGTASESGDILLKSAYDFQQASKGAHTDLRPRQRRYEALKAYIIAAQQ
ncbi:MAG: DUF262 domain-containing protein [Planctomycetaceae bacterium]|nr:DUF262 domain-containing protein [Planctomycetaceae bacterium]